MERDRGQCVLWPDVCEVSADRCAGDAECDQTPDGHDRARTIVSVLFANVATVIGFGLLSFSQVPILRAIGSTVGLGAVLSLVFAAIFIAHTAPVPVAKLR